MPLSVNSRLGPYEIKSTLGVGGMGEVYRARDSRLNRDVAIKVLRQRPAHPPTSAAASNAKPAPSPRSIIPMSSPSTTSASKTGSNTS